MGSLDSVFAAFAPASQFPLTPLTDRAMDVLMPRIVPLGPVRVVTNSFLTLELGEVDLRATIQTASRHLALFEVFVDDISFYVHNDGRSIRGWHLPDGLRFREFNPQ